MQFDSDASPKNRTLPTERLKMYYFEVVLCQTDQPFERQK